MTLVATALSVAWVPTEVLPPSPTEMMLSLMPAARPKSALAEAAPVVAEAVAPATLIWVTPMTEPLPTAIEPSVSMPTELPIRASLWAKSLLALPVVVAMPMALLRASSVTLAPAPALRLELRKPPALVRVEEELAMPLTLVASAVMLPTSKPVMVAPAPAVMPTLLAKPTRPELAAPLALPSTVPETAAAVPFAVPLRTPPLPIVMSESLTKINAISGQLLSDEGQK